MTFPTVFISVARLSEEKNTHSPYFCVLLLIVTLLAGQVPLAQGPEPKSTHTWLDSDQTEIYSYNIDIRVTDFPSQLEPNWLYYFSLQVNFTDHDEWSHGGFQYAAASEFANNNNLGVNWGGGSDWAGYGGIGRTNTPYTWETDTWYRYRVWRLEKEQDGLWRWLFTVTNYETGEERQLGTVVTKSDWIKNAVVWIETGYGVQCDTEKVRIEWRNPQFNSAAGTFVPNKATADYNGTCEGALSTNQGMISTQPLTWYQETHANREVAKGTRMW